MATEILMPKLSSTMEFGTITEWYKQVGDVVEIGDVLFEVMTDKIAIEVEAYEDGVLIGITVDKNVETPVNAVVGYIGEVGETLTNTHETVSDKSECNDDASSVVRATPSARRVAREYGIDLRTLKGSGSYGRIHKEDVLTYARTMDQPQAFVPVQETSEPETMTSLRKAIWNQMVRSKQTIPHCTLVATACIDRLETMRTELNSRYTETKITLTDLLILVLVKALKAYPSFNGNSTKDGYNLYESIHLGVAVALETGLVVPVIHHANNLSIRDIAHQKKVLIDKARSNTLSQEDMTGGTFTLSVIGKGVVKGFTPIINAPELAILGVGSVYESMCIVEGAVSVQKDVDLSLSFDHRILDGAPAALFIEHIVTLIEQPLTLLY